MLTKPQPQIDASSPVAGIGAVDCDVHIRSPEQADLQPYYSAYWKDMSSYREMGHLELTSYPYSTRPFSRPGTSGGGATDARELQANLLDPLQLGAATLNVVNGAQALYDPYMAAAVCQATNRWIVAEWLDRDPRLRASLLVPFQHPDEAVAEIRRYAGDRRFVQILAIAQGIQPLGQRAYWPIYRAAADAGFALSIHPGSGYRHAPTAAGYPSYLVEEQVYWSQAFGSQVMSLLAEGVFTEFPGMKVVMAESGVSWLFGISWRVAKDWRGARMEVPWIKESPEEIIQRNLRMTIQPFDGPPDAADGATVIECIGSSDMLLYASDYPHDYPGAIGAWPEAIPTDLVRQISRDNAFATYPRLEVNP